MTVAAGAGCRLGELPVRELGLAAGGQVLARLLVRRLRASRSTTTTSPAPAGTRAPPTRRPANPPASFGGGSASTLAFSLYATLGAAPTPPANTVLPAITGTAHAGSGADDDERAPGRAARPASPTSGSGCDSAGANCAAISGATASSYTLVAADIDKTIRVVVTATNANGSTPATSNQTAVVATQPVAAGEHGAAGDQRDGRPQGQTLTTTNGSWTNTPTATPISGSAATRAGRAASAISGATARPTRSSPPTSARRSGSPSPRPTRRGSHPGDLGPDRAS